MGNKSQFKLNIDAEGLVRILKEKRTSIRELAKKDMVNHSERHIRVGLKTRKMTLPMIMEICTALNLVFAIDPDHQFTVFHNPETDGWLNMFKVSGYTYWEPVTDPSGFMYPKPCQHTVFHNPELEEQRRKHYAAMA